MAEKIREFHQMIVKKNIENFVTQSQKINSEIQ